MRMRNKNDHAFSVSPWRYISLDLYLCERHEGSLSEKAHSRAPTEPIYVKIMVPSCVVRELYRSKKKMKKMEKS